MATFQPIHGVPTLTELEANPAHAASLPVEVVADLLDRAAALHSRLQAALTAQLLRSVSGGAGSGPEGPDRLLTVSDTAARLQTSVDWVYRHSPHLPFTVRNGRQVRFSEVGLTRWIRNRQGRA